MSLSRLQVWKICWAACACLETLLSQQEGLYLLHCFIPTWDKVLCNCLYSWIEHSGCLFETQVLIPLLSVTWEYIFWQTVLHTVSSFSFLWSWDFDKCVGLQLYNVIVKEDENTGQSLLRVFLLIKQISESAYLYIPFCKSSACFPIKDNVAHAAAIKLSYRLWL